MCLWNNVYFLFSNPSLKSLWLKLCYSQFCDLLRFPCVDLHMRWWLVDHTMWLCLMWNMILSNYGDDDLSFTQILIFRTTWRVQSILVHIWLKIVNVSIDCLYFRVQLYIIFCLIVLSFMPLAILSIIKRIPLRSYLRICFAFGMFTEHHCHLHLLYSGSLYTKHEDQQHKNNLIQTNWYTTTNVKSKLNLHQLNSIYI